MAATMLFMEYYKRIFLIIVVLITCVSCDQGTKIAAQSCLPQTQAWSFLGDSLRLQLSYNTGAFLSLGANLPETWPLGLFSVGAGLMLLILLGFILFSQSLARLELLALCFMFAGGASNLVDRLTLGYVVDFINIGIGHLRTGVFNVADVARLCWRAFNACRCVRLLIQSSAKVLR